MSSLPDAMTMTNNHLPLSPDHRPFVIVVSTDDDSNNRTSHKMNHPSASPNMKRSLSADSPKLNITVTNEDDSSDNDGDITPPIEEDLRLPPRSRAQANDALSLPAQPQLTHQQSSFHRLTVAIVRRIKTQMDLGLMSHGSDIQFKLFFTMLLTLSSIAAAYFLKDDRAAKYKFIASNMLFILGFFFVSFLYFVCTCTQLHRLVVITARMQPDFGSIVFPIKIDQLPNQPIKSMSELFALRGTSIHVLFSFVCNTIGVLIFLAVLLNWFDINQNDYDNAWSTHHLANFLGICGGIATPLMGNYDLNPNSKGHVAMHYIGVTLMGTSVWSVGIVFDWSYKAIALIATTMFVLGVWLFLSTIYYPDIIQKHGNMTHGDVKKKVHRISIVCIVSETIGCILASTCNILYVWNLRDVDMLCDEADGC